MSFQPVYRIPDELPRPSWWFLFKGKSILVDEGGDFVGIPFFSDPGRDVPGDIRRSCYLGVMDGYDCYGLSIDGRFYDPRFCKNGFALVGLKSLYGVLSETLYRSAGYAMQVVEWVDNHRFCGRCGEGTRDKPEERARFCPSCGLVNYPRISPAIIVSVTSGSRILLARSARYKPGRYSVIAGYIEPGETAEECVRREIYEEVGISVSGIRYFGSQSWPFSGSIMLGYTAKYAGGELRVDGEEIVEAGWFFADALPGLPGKMSIARELIDDFVESVSNGLGPKV